jgi:hydroxymethylglutaryl-CoA reductase (NADPH)
MNQYNTLKLYNLEKEIPNLEEAVKIRRRIIESKTKKNVLKNIPFKNYSYDQIHGRCCENVIGYIPVPLGLAGPILLNDKEYYLPMATTEGTLVASTSRGANAITQSGGCHAIIINDGITRAPVITCQNAQEALTIKEYTNKNFQKIKEAFESGSQYAKLTNIKSTIVGRHIYLRFKCTSGDAMGMNMIGKCTELSLKIILNDFPNASLKSLSGNMCTDKKASAINNIEGRGKSVICEAIIKEEIVENVLKTTPKTLVELNYLKNMLGSNIAVTIGGNNAHAANIVTAMFLACGQDVAQNVESSHCITLMELADNQKDLYISVTMPCLEVGTIGGGTHLPAQSANLDLLGVKGSQKQKNQQNQEHQPGENACQLAKIISSGVLAGELSLMSALSNNTLINAHMKLNRKKIE